MSNQIQFDPLLVHYLASELHLALQGRATGPMPIFAEDRSVTLLLDAGQALRFDLHPARGWVRLVETDQPVDPQLEARILSVTWPPDERILSISYQDSGRFRALRRRLVVELHTNQWNAIVVDEEMQKVVAALRTRSTGGRSVQPGAEYLPPSPQPRIGTGAITEDEAWVAWLATLRPISPEQRVREVVRHFAYTGSLNARYLLADAATREGKEALRSAFRHWWTLRGLPSANPVLLDLPKGTHPYPFALPGISADPIPSLLEGMTRVAGAEAPSAAPAAPEIQWIQPAERRWRSALRRAERLREQLARTGEAERLRRCGDLLLAHLSQVARGAGSVRLRDWDGDEVEIPLDPALAPSENANRLYAEARRQARAEEQIPKLLEEAEAEAARWEQAVSALRQGELPAWVPAELSKSTGGSRPGEDRQREALPYRRFRTSGGLEVRVGRSSRDNDRLTFGHSAPADVWLHARSVPGSHIILRWPDPEAAPPARDLSEAAGLAAWFSKARTSSLVAVDWTRRKYVRKPRGAAPGLVIPQRVKTLFVEPDPELETRLREEG